MSLHHTASRRAVLSGVAALGLSAAAAPIVTVAQTPGTRRDSLKYPWASSGDPRLQVVYPRQSTEDDPRVRYPVDVIRFALGKAGVPYGFRLTDQVYTQKRAMLTAQSPIGNNILHAGASTEFAEQLEPVWFPTSMGLLGLRVFLINSARQSDFSGVRSIEDLRQYEAVQGIGWPDVQILEAAGLPVRTDFYDTLFRRVAQGYSDYFPRSAIEVLPELEANKSQFPALAIEQSLALSYRYDTIFYTSPYQRGLNEALTAGLWQGYRDGSWFDFVKNHPFVQDLGKRLNLSQRRTLQIENPLLPKEMREIPNDLWMNIGVS